MNIDDSPGTLQSSFVDICCTGEFVYAVWDTTVGGSRRVFFSCSTAGMLNWTTSIRLDSEPSPAKYYGSSPKICATGPDIYVVWPDNIDGYEDIFFNCSHDQGRTWQSQPTRLNVGDAIGAHVSISPQIACSNDAVYAVWMDERNGKPDIYFNFSSDRGDTWQSTDIRLDTGDIPGSSYSASPQIVNFGDVVFVVWRDMRSGYHGIFGNYSVDGGVSWLDSARRLDGTPQQHSAGAKLSTSSGKIHLIWGDLRNGEADIYYNGTISTDNYGVYRPESSQFFLDMTWDGFSEKAIVFGRSGDIPVSGDWDGDGDSDYGVYRPSECIFFLDTNNDHRAELIFPFGKKGDIPVMGDWNGDGKTNYGIYRPDNSRFYLDTDWDSLADIVRSYGRLGDTPISGDWDGDGRTNYGVYRPSLSIFFMDTNFNSYADMRYAYGLNGDIPVTGDWDGNGTTNYGVYRPDRSRFFLDTDWDPVDNIQMNYGRKGDIPLIGNWGFR